MVARVSEVRGRDVRCTDNGCELRGWLRAYLQTFAILCALSAVSMLLVLRGSLILRLVIAVVLAGLSFYSWDSSLSRIRIGADGVTVKNGHRARVFSWAEFHSFVLAPRGTIQAGHVKTADGQHFRCDILTPSGILGGKRHVEPLIHHLNIAVDKHRRS